MNILFIFHTAGFNSGACNSGFNLLRGLRNNGYNVAVILPQEGDIAEELSKLDIKVFIAPVVWAYPDWPNDILRKLWRFPRLLHYRFLTKKSLKLCSDFIKDFSPDIIHSNTSVINLGNKLSRKYGIPHVVHHREFGMRDCRAIMWHLPGVIANPLSYHISVSKCVEDNHKLRGKLRSKVIYNGIYDRENQFYNPQKSDYFLYVGGIYPAKGLEDLLHAYGKASLVDKSLPILKIVGGANPNYQKKLDVICDSYGISSAVEWVGKVNDPRILMQKAKALIVPSYFEAFGRIVAEAMFNGCMVIGRNNVGIKEQFDNGAELCGHDIGLRFNSIDELTTILQTVARNYRENEEYYNNTILLGQQCAVKLYSNESYVNRVVDLYEEILSNK